MNKEVKMKEIIKYDIPETEEERIEREVDVLLNKEHNLAIQNYLAPDLTDDQQRALNTMEVKDE